MDEGATQVHPMPPPFVRRSSNAPFLISPNTVVRTPIKTIHVNVLPSREISTSCTWSGVKIVEFNLRGQHP